MGVAAIAVEDTGVVVAGLAIVGSQFPVVGDTRSVAVATLETVLADLALMGPNQVVMVV